MDVSCNWIIYDDMTYWIKECLQRGNSSVSNLANWNTNQYPLKPEPLTLPSTKGSPCAMVKLHGRWSDIFPTESKHNGHFGMNP